MRAALRRMLDQRARPLPARLRNIVVLLALAAVVAASVWAWRSSGLTAGDLEWPVVAASFFVAAPLSLALKVAEFQVAARIVGQRPGRRRSLDVAVVSSAANLLPLPGSLLVTIRSLSEDGSSYGTALTASAVPGFAWLGITGLVGGSAIAIEGPAWLGALTIVGGIAAFAVAGALFSSTAPPHGRTGLMMRILAVEAGWLAVSAFRLGLAVAALGQSVEPTQALALSVAGALTVAIGFFPGGLGVREALIAGLSPLIGLPFDAGILIGSLDRVVWLAFLAVAAAALAGTARIRP